MQSRRLGNSGLIVPALGLGTAAWGTGVDAIDAADILGVFADAGGTLLDCAGHYGAGGAEEMVGSLLTRNFRRADFVLATQAGLAPGAKRPINGSRRGMLAALDRSLARLGTDHVDLWQVAAFDAATPLEETLSALDHALSSGRARYAGVARFSGWQLAAAATRQQCTAPKARIVSAGLEYSLLNRSAEAEVLPAATALGVGVLAYAPLGGGVLTGKYRHSTPLESRAARSDDVDRYLNPTARLVVDAVATAADGLGVAPLEVAFAWVRDRPGVAAAVVGTRTAAQLKAVAAAEALTLPEEIRRALDDASGSGPT